MRKPTILGSDQFRHEPACTVTEADQKLEILDLCRTIVLSEWRKQTGADQLCSHCTADLICAFCFAYADCWFSHAATQI